MSVSECGKSENRLGRGWGLVCWSFCVVTSWLYSLAVLTTTKQLTSRMPGLGMGLRLSASVWWGSRCDDGGTNTFDRLQSLASINEL